MKFVPKLSNNRLVILDQLRGLCLAIIIVDHVGLFPTAFEIFTGRQSLWITAAEGFFLISGLLVGLIRQRQAERDGFRAAARAVWDRAGKLYLATIVLTLMYTGLAYWLYGVGIEGSKNGLAYFGSLPELLWRTATLTYTYGWSDFLPYYVIYLALAPLALWLLRRGKWRWVAGAAVAGWLLPLVIPYLFPAGLRWQAYFFIGAVIGFHHEDVRRWWAEQTAEWRSRASRAVVVTAMAGLALSAMITLWPVYWPEVYNPLMNTLRTIDGSETYRFLFGNDRTGVLRLPFFLVAFAAFYLAFQRFQKFIMRWANWLLEPLGRNSLYVYIVQGAAVFLVRLVAPPNNFFLNTLIDVVVVLVIWWLVKQRVLFRIIPR